MLLSKMEIFIKDRLISNGKNQTEAINEVKHLSALNTNLIEHFISEGVFTPEEIAKDIATVFNYDYKEIVKKDIDEGLTQKNIDLCKKHLCVFLKSVDEILVVSADPTRQEMLSELDFYLNEKYHVYVGKISAIKKHLSYFTNVFSQKQKNTSLKSKQEFDVVDISNEADLLDSGSENIVGVNKLVMDALQKGASDIHIEPKEDTCKVRYRVDGKMYDVDKKPKDTMNGIIARIKIISGLNIAQKRMPQEGRFSIKADAGNKIDFRVSIMPVIWGEKVVIRVLDNLQSNIGINKIGMNDKQKALYLEALSKKQGLVLVTGPTGAGKSITLFSGIAELPCDSMNIITVESPVEIQMESINQINIQDKQGLSYSKTLRYVLRQDPDVIMIGEIRDTETLEIALKASQTGHLVLSTLHAKDSIQVIERLETMESSIFNIVNAINLICSQRLFRKLCNNCKVEKKVEPHLVEEFNKLGLNLKAGETYHQHNEEGCDECHDGYSGRTALFEVLKLDEELKLALLKKEPFSKIEEMAINKGFLNFNTVALDAIKNGIISLEEYISNVS